jgi:hypothetical protein
VRQLIQLEDHILALDVGLGKELDRVLDAILRVLGRRR